MISINVERALALFKEAKTPAERVELATKAVLDAQRELRRLKPQFDAICDAYRAASRSLEEAHLALKLACDVIDSA